MKYPDEFKKIFEFPPLDEIWNNYIANETEIFWVCAYGSLLWYPNFSADTRVLGYFNNVERQVTHGSFRFGNTDWPGRVATLYPNPGKKTWGAAYKVTGSASKKVAFERMVEREIEQNYELAITNFYPIDGGPPIRGAVYIALPENRQSLVDVPLEIQAYQIAHAKGTNGPNRNYVYNIANFLEAEIFPVVENSYDPSEDPIIALARLVKEFVEGTRTLSDDEMKIAQPRLCGTRISLQPCSVQQ